MKKEDLKEFITLMMGISELFGAKVSNLGIELMSKALRPYTIEQITEAANLIVRTRKYTTMPTVADFIEAIEGSEEDQATVQASIVWDAISRVGAYDSVQFRDSTTAAVVRDAFGGWSRICRETKEDNRVWFMKEFKEQYKSYKHSGIEHNGPLFGEFGGQPVMITGPEKKDGAIQRRLTAA